MAEVVRLVHTCRSYPTALAQPRSLGALWFQKEDSCHTHSLYPHYHLVSHVEPQRPKVYRSRSSGLWKMDKLGPAHPYRCDYFICLIVAASAFTSALTLRLGIMGRLTRTASSPWRGISIKTAPSRNISTTTKWTSILLAKKTNRSLVSPNRTTL